MSRRKAKAVKAELVAADAVATDPNDAALREISRALSYPSSAVQDHFRSILQRSAANGRGGRRD